MIARELESECTRCKGRGVILVAKRYDIIICTCTASRHLAARISRADGHWANGERR